MEELVNNEPVIKSDDDLRDHLYCRKASEQDYNSFIESLLRNQIPDMISHTHMLSSLPEDMANAFPSAMPSLIHLNASAGLTLLI